MATSTKITISEHELVCLQDTDFLLTKRAISEKVQVLFMKLATRLADEPNATSLPHIRTKVSKGDNYRGLPYWVLDYPAIFNQEDIFAYRTVCRWGHEFSFTLHLAGAYLEEHKSALLQNYTTLKTQEELYLCINTTMWEHHFDADNYSLFNEAIVNESAWATFLAEKGFVKLAFKMPLEAWDEVVDKGVEVWQLLGKALLHVNFKG
jgi:hypothetical protein